MTTETPALSGNIAAHLPRMAQLHPDHLAVAVQRPGGATGRHRYATWTLKQLDDQSDRIAHGLDRVGIGRGVRAVLMVKPSLEFFALTFALFKAGSVPVLVDPGMGIKNLKTCLAEAEPQAFIGIPKAHIARQLFGWGKPTVKTLVSVGPKLFLGGYTLDGITLKEPRPFAPVEPAPGETAAILFTSGSTGIPKGAVYTHENFNAQVEILREDYGIQPGEKDLATFPLFALFGPALGMAAVIPDMDASQPATSNPRHIVDAIHDNHCTNLFASPALIELVGQYGIANGITLPTLKRVISAGAPASNPSLARFAKLLPDDVEIFPSYGATEALPVAFIGSKELLSDTAEATDQGAGVCVGRTVHGVEASVIHIADDPIEHWSDKLHCAPGEIGEITVTGPVVTKAYYNRPDSTKLAKIKHPYLGIIYHRMGDVGYFDDQGRLWMCGRKAHRVVTPEATLFTIPVERIFNTHPAVKRTALVGVSKGGVTIPVLCVEKAPDTGGRDDETIINELKAIGGRHEITRPVHTFLFHPAFPVDVRHNAKIFREELAEWAKGKFS
ncbi:MAG: AMP-binding protein [Candidatus Hydrogenedentes bacterium]|nr:AMP-binding protein [Candidatus Hydrogenedentota bacterium]